MDVVSLGTWREVLCIITMHVRIHRSHLLLGGYCCLLGSRTVAVRVSGYQHQQRIPLTKTSVAAAIDANDTRNVFACATVERGEQAQSLRV